MKKSLTLLLLAVICSHAWAQTPAKSKQERRKNLVVREYNQRAGSTERVLDNVVTYDALGRKIEEIEYASYGQKRRSVYKYQGENLKCHEEVEYNDKNKVKCIKRYEYNDDGTKKRQYTYSTKGKLKSTKEFEYSYK